MSDRISNEKRIDAIIETVINIEDPETAINTMLTLFGKQIHAERTYIFECLNEDYITNTYEWCAEGVSQQIDNLQTVPMAVYGKTWADQLENKQMIVIDDVAAYKSVDPGVYEILTMQGINCIICTPLFADQKYMGFMGIDNPAPSTLKNDTTLLHMLSAFAAALIRHRDNVLRIRELSQIDTVTKTYNLMYFLEKMQLDLESRVNGHTLAKTYIIHFNIAQFKVYNDAYGFNEGNACLRQFADLLKHVFGEAYVSRFSSDRFVVFYFKDDVIDKIREVHEHGLHSTGRIKLAIKAGIAMPKDTRQLDRYCDYSKVACDAITDNDLAFYNVYESELGEAIIKKKYIQDHVGDAIGAGYIKIYFQPVVRAMTGKLCSFEALTRWQDPTYGMISPGEFIPALEEKHLCYQVDFYVVDEVCHLLSERLKNHQPTVPVSINLSRRDFTMADPVAFISGTVQKYNLPPQYLCIEITESAVMEAPKTVRSAIGRFHRTGFQVWMDDFGSAYSSLNALKDFPFDEIKIDMAFMRNLNKRSKTIIQDVVSMAKTLGMHTLCEGVETKAQLNFLREIGCERIQGYYYGKPLPLDEQLAHLRDIKILFETPEEERLADKFGFAPFSPDDHFCVVCADSKRAQIIQTIFANRRFMHLLTGPAKKHSEAERVRKMNAVLNDQSIAFGRLMVKTMNETVRQQKTHTFFATIDGRNCKFVCHFIAKKPEKAGGIVTIYSMDITDDEKDGKVAYLLRCVAGAYDEIYFINPDNHTTTVVRSMIPGENVGDLLDLRSDKLASRIAEVDRARYDKAMTAGYRDAQTRAAGRESYLELFWGNLPDGSHRCYVFTTIRVSYRGKYGYLVCIRPFALADGEDMDQANTIGDTYHVSKDAPL